MATLGDLKTRIKTEMVRTDLNDELASTLDLHIQRACEYFADERFWFNAYIGTVACVPGSQTVSVPVAIRRVDRVSIPSIQVEVREVLLTEFPDFVASAIPQVYAYDNDALIMYPTPDQAYSLRVVGTKQINAPATDADSNEWTNEAQDLIVARAKMTLYRDQFRDLEGVGIAKSATEEELTRLKRETARRLEIPLRPRYPRFSRADRINIYTGF
jgi:hypothetical protein